MNAAPESRLIVTPHPVLLDGQRNVAVDLRPGESLQQFLARHIDLSESWEASIGGAVIPCEHWDRIKPKDGQIIEVRGAVNRQALYLVAMVALMYFTYGLGTAGAAGAGSGFVVGTYGAIAAAGVYIGGPAIGGKEIA
jgi:trimeric autotransporter adhesin